MESWQLLALGLGVVSIVLTVVAAVVVASAAGSAAAGLVAGLVVLGGAVSGSWRVLDVFRSTRL